MCNIVLNVPWKDMTCINAWNDYFLFQEKVRTRRKVKEKLLEMSPGAPCNIYSCNVFQTCVFRHWTPHQCNFICWANRVQSATWWNQLMHEDMHNVSRTGESNDRREIELCMKAIDFYDPFSMAKIFCFPIAWSGFVSIDLTDYSFLPSSLVSMLTYFNMSSRDEGYIPVFSYTKLFLVDLRPNNQVVFSRTAQETSVSVLHENEAIG